MPSPTPLIDLVEDTLRIRTGSITWQTHAYGWEGSLIRLATDKNNYEHPKHIRAAADKAIKKIERQLKDKRLMAMRERLIKASKAGDEPQVKQITQQIRAYNKEDLETGLY